MRPSPAAINLIKSFESFRSRPYLDTGNVPTIGYGATVYPDGRKVAMKDAPIDEPTALEYLEHHVEWKVCPVIDAMVRVPLSQCQYDALTSFVYNVGRIGPTMLAKLNAGDFRGAANEFPRWNKDDGRVVDGLTRRRASERALFLGTAKA